MTNRRFEGKVALITGGTEGIGASAAALFASEGASVVITGRRPGPGERLCEKLGSEGQDVAFIRGDVSDENDVRRVVAETVERYGRIDCAVNNAGVEGKVSSIFDLPASDWDHVVGVNLRGVFLCMKHQSLHMKATGGAIVNVGSVSSFRGSPALFAYSAAKHGVIGLTRSASAELSAFRIRVNAVCPGVIETPMYRRLRATAGDSAFDAYIQTRTHLQRAGLPHEAAGPILWLCSEEASYITGSVIVPDGGITAT